MKTVEEFDKEQETLRLTFVSNSVCSCKKPKRYIYGVRQCEKCGKELPLEKQI